MSVAKQLLLIITSLAGAITISQSMEAQSTTGTAPVRIAVAGITHGHAGFILGRKPKPDIVLVGIYEPNTDLAKRYAKSFNINPALFYTDLEKMLAATKPEAVVAFGSIYEHMAVVEACAPKGIHVMVEKPMATNLAHALKMEQLAKKHNILLLTNYETSWYPTTEKVYQLANDSNYMGAIKKVVIHDGHKGPKEIGVNKEFLDWLTDPIQNGGGALIDFGCYGANLMTYLMRGEKPVSVTAITQQFKPHIYPKVDDEATIIVTYPSAQCIIQASWNWPFSRKDMEVYGETGYAIAVNNSTLRLKNKEAEPEKSLQLTAKKMGVYDDPISYFADVVRNKIRVPAYGLYSLENNVMVVRILEAASESAKSGKTIMLSNLR
ncbi:Gfo/Idh/MocA family protein [Terrimonas pollutisoli]|uniref:Gfo/Idh/MocA family protein n=1 Tax=Terrimonas pollutisoli TaxID=3034147 RepID=UPI0023EC6C6F|nr:Gfo/Idh/MocA family oxidoreductase [Terrimonas sp. H1YJ31]